MGYYVTLGIGKTSSNQWISLLPRRKSCSGRTPFRLTMPSRGETFWLAARSARTAVAAALADWSSRALSRKKGARAARLYLHDQCGKS